MDRFSIVSRSNKRIKPSKVFEREDNRFFIHCHEGTAITAKEKKTSDQPKPPFLFEISWEVCSQVGGIYTVLRSKTPATLQQWGDDYWLIGPYREEASLEFEPIAVDGPVGQVVDELRSQGIGMHYGRWLIPGRPRVILIDIDSVPHAHDVVRYFFWKDHGIECPSEDQLHARAVVFGSMVADLLQAIRQKVNPRPMLAHFHEWQGSAALPILKQRKEYIPSIFTTHATLVGRGLCSANVDLYTYLPGIGGEAVAYEHQMGHRYKIERAAAHSAQVFTTVSDITGLEAEQFLGRAPDVVLPNGLNVERFTTPYQFQILHRQYKQQIHEFVMGHFFSSYTFDLDKTLYTFIAGRYEYRNKGMDVYIEALHQLNQRLKAEGTDMTLVAFIISPAAFKGFNVESLNRQAMANELRKTCQNIQQDMGRKLFHTIAHGQLPTTDELLDEQARIQLRRIMYAWRQRPLPPIVTHDLWNDGGDPVLSHLRYRQLFNAPDDPVKVVFHPQFITSTSPILPMEYDQFIRGCHMGVFPSYYEPWGYTPMECVVRGIPAITSDLSGFGSYVMSHFPDHDSNGIFVARRRGRDFKATTAQVASWLYELTRMARPHRIQLRNRVETYAGHFEWTNMSRYYHLARRLAFQRVWPKRDILPAEPPEQPAAREETSL